jgi:hypothetical protein
MTFVALSPCLINTVPGWYTSLTKRPRITFEKEASVRFWKSDTDRRNASSSSCCSAGREAEEAVKVEADEDIGAGIGRRGDVVVPRRPWALLCLLRGLVASN